MQATLEESRMDRCHPDFLFAALSVYTSRKDLNAVHLASSTGQIAFRYQFDLSTEMWGDYTSLLEATIPCDFPQGPSGADPTSFLPITLQGLEVCYDTVYR